MSILSEPIAENRSFGGRQLRLEHQSECTGTTMQLSVYLPPREGPLPVLWYLSGLTCTDQNVVTKGGYQRLASELGMIVVCPDTSPRGAGIEGEDGSWDLGTGAGFYLDATAEPWSTNYRMESYLVEELPRLLLPALPADTERQGIFGHSMGGHGALTLALKHPERYRSVSAFAPISSPSQVPWGHKAFGAYLKERDEWAAHDASELVRGGRRCAPILIDQGTADSFLAEQLRPELFEEVCREAGQELVSRRQEGYDHSYFFIATFMDDHLRHHAKSLGWGA